MSDGIKRAWDEVGSPGHDITHAHALLDLRRRLEAIEARYTAQQTPANAPLVLPGDDSRFSRVAPSGGDSGHLSPPPDDDPEWRDVPAELATLASIRTGDRVFCPYGWATMRNNHYKGSATDEPDHWVKRHDHPTRQTADVKGSELRVGDVVVGCKQVGKDYVPQDPETVEYTTDYRPVNNYRVRLPRPESTPETAYVSGSRLRIGDVLADGRRVVSFDAERWPVVESGTRLTPEYVYFVRMPRPAAEPSAKVKCATCRCMIVPGTTCACCESTSGDDPPLPSLDRDEEPSGEGIARFERARLVIGSDEWALSDLQAHQPTSWVPRMVAAINAAHAHATRELRERCERAERMRDSLALQTDRDVVTIRDLGTKLADRTEVRALIERARKAETERNAAIARAEAAERVVKYVREVHADLVSPAGRKRFVHGGPRAMGAEIAGIGDALAAYDRARKDSAT